MLPLIAGGPAQEIDRARLRYEAAPLPSRSGFFAKAKGARGKERYPDDIAEDGAVLVPADGGVFRVFSDEDLLQLAGSKRRKTFRLDARIGKEAGHVLGLRESAAIEIVSPAERHHAPLALESLKLEFLKRQSFEILQEGRILPPGSGRLVAETIGQRIASEEIKRRATAAHASSSGRFPPSFLSPCWPRPTSLVVGI